MHHNGQYCDAHTAVLAATAIEIKNSLLYREVIQLCYL